MNEEPAAHRASFRDPSGFVFTHDGVLYRQVNRAFSEDFEHLLRSGLYSALVEEGLLISHEDADQSLAQTSEGYRVIRPQPVDFVSYPYEWCFGQLQQAALATLQIQKRALEFGMSLRDASAYNVQFHQGRPVLIDTLSFEVLRPGQPWIAYRQFSQHFVAPLALMSYVDVRLGQLLRVHLDGIPLDLTAELLPARAKTKGALLLHLFLHARSQRRHERSGVGRDEEGRTFGEQAFRGLVSSLEHAVSRLKWEPDPSVWSDYYGMCESYEAEALDHKKELVTELLAEAAPTTVWDLGANTGLFSRIAASRGARVVSFEVDPGCVERSYRQVVANGETGVLPLLMDLANPSPAQGWEHGERMSLAERGPVDLVMALALVHHLAIGNNVPLRRVAGFLRELGEWALVEFVPKGDPEAQELLSSREDVFPHYTREGFEAALSERFTIERREEIRGSERALYLARGR